MLFSNVLLRRTSNTKYVLAFLILIFLSTWSIAQSEYHSLNPSNFKLLKNVRVPHEIYYEDSYGFIWMGTHSGLTRYNPHNLKRYDHDINNPNSIQPFFVKSIYEDSKHNFWIGYGGGGLGLLHRENDTFSHYEYSTGCTNCLNNNKVTSIVEDDNGVLWIGTDGGGINYIYNKNDTFQFRNISNESLANYPDQIINTLYNQKGEGIYIGGDSGLYFMSYDKITYDSRGLYDELQFQKIPILTENTSSGIYSILSIFIDKDLNLWLGTEGDGLLISKPDEKNQYSFFKQFISVDKDNYSLYGSNVSSIKEDLFGNIWIGTINGGVNFITSEAIKTSSNDGFKSLNFINIKNDLKSTVVSEIPAVQNIMVDRNGIVWFGTLRNDFVYDYKQTKFHVITIPEGIQQAKIDNTLWVYIENEKTWLGSFGSSGLFSLEFNKDEIDSYVIKQPNLQLSTNEELSGFICDPDYDKYYLITTNQGMYRVNKDNWEIVELSYFPDAKFSEAYLVPTLWADSYHRIWLLTWGHGLSVLNKERTKYYSINHSEDDSLSLSNNNIMSVCQDSEKNFWVGTFDGVNFIDSASFHNIEELLEKDQFRFNWNSKNKTSPIKLPHNFICKVLPSDDGTVLIGSFGGGISVIKDYKIIETLTERDGLCDNYILSMLEDNFKNIWIGTSNGLSMYNPTQKSFKNFDLSDGVGYMDFMGTDITHAKTQSGDLLFGTATNGITFISPENVVENRVEPDVFITDIKLFNESLEIDEEGFLKKSSLFTEKLILPYNKNFISFEFAALNYTNPQKNQYYYQLVGLNEDWVSNGTRNNVDFQGLSPGNYTLKLRGTNNDGIGNKIKSLSITILSPPWATWWAYTGYGLFAIGLILLWRQYDLKRWKLKHQADHLLELDQLKSRFFSNISHEFRTPITLILGPLKSMYAGSFSGNLKKTYGVMLKNGIRLQKLINQLLDISKIEAGKMNMHVKKVEFVDFIRSVISMFESLANEKNIKISFFSDVSELDVFIDQEKIRKVFYNLISNAIKFSLDGENVLIRISNEAKDRVCISVQDKGPGIREQEQDKIFDRFYQVDSSSTREHEGTGLGMAIAKEMIELHHGEILVSSQYRSGTTFKVFLKLGKVHFSGLDIETKPDIKPNFEALNVNASIDAIEDEVEKKEESTTVEKPILLIIEDNGDMRFYIRSILEDDFRIEESSRGNEGIEKAFELIPDLVLCDIMMPGIDGYEVLNTLKTDKRTSHIPVVMLTAKADSKSKLEGLEKKADDYLIKPFNEQELKLRITNLLEIREQLRNKYRNEIVLEPEKTLISSIDEKFLSAVLKNIDEHMEDFEFSSEDLSKDVGLSRSHFYRKIKSLTGLTPSNFLVSIRLKKAATLLKNKTDHISQIAYTVGFQSLPYFNKRFREQYKMSPSDYIKSFQQ